MKQMIRKLLARIIHWALNPERIQQEQVQDQIAETIIQRLETEATHGNP